MERDHEKIRARAYEIWNQDGRQDGRDHEYWLQAERELSAAQGADQGAVPVGATATPGMGSDTALAGETAAGAADRKKANGAAKAVAAKAAAPRKRRGAQPVGQA